MTDAAATAQADLDGALPVSAVMMSVAKHVAVRCQSENKAFMDCKKQDRNPAKCLEQGKEITKCVMTLYLHFSIR